MADSRPQGVELDPSDLSPTALRGLVEEFVSREGTDYGPGEWSLEEKVEQVLDQIGRGEARIVFDLELETVGIVPTSG
ncbi:MAG TPA: YheU family protein [Deltaproteobacteria bacterium]|nr:YheU family protein [Deltaproteobacteria bacterium]